MKEELPRSLVAFEAELQDAVRRELDAASAPAGRFVRRAGGLARAPRRVLAATGAAGLSLAGVSAAVVLLLGTGATSPAYAVTRNTNGTVTLHFLRPSGIDAANIHGLNARLAAMGVRASVAPVPPGELRLHGAVTCPAMQPVTVSPAELKHAMILRVDHSGSISVPAVRTQVLVGTAQKPAAAKRSGGQMTSSGTGNSGNSGNSGSDNSGAPGVRVPAGAGPAPPPASGRGVQVQQVAVRCGGAPPPAGGNSGNSGNSGSGTGNSGNSGQN